MQHYHQHHSNKHCHDLEYEIAVPSVYRDLETLNIAINTTMIITIIIIITMVIIIIVTMMIIIKVIMIIIISNQFQNLSII